MEVSTIGEYAYYKDQVLGKGNFAIVYKGYIISNPSFSVAVKIIDYDKVEKKNRFVVL